MSIDQIEPETDKESKGKKPKFKQSLIIVACFLIGFGVYAGAYFVWLAPQQTTQSSNSGHVAAVSVVGAACSEFIRLYGVSILIDPKKANLVEGLKAAAELTNDEKFRTEIKAYSESVNLFTSTPIEKISEEQMLEYSTRLGEIMMRCVNEGVMSENEMRDFIMTLTNFKQGS